MGEHAVLSASSSKKWINCSASIELESFFEDKSSVYADEGTLAHKLAEVQLRFLTGAITKRKFNSETKKIEEEIGAFYKEQYSDINEVNEKIEEMALYINVFISHIQEIFNVYKSQDVDTVLEVEKRLDYSSVAKDGFGTGDVVILSGTTIHIIDLKYGKGVKVDSDNNTQLMLYGLGALNEYDNDLQIETVKFTIGQPRLDHISDWEMSATELYDFGESVIKPKAELALEKGNTPCAGSHCVDGFCKAKKTCKAFTNRHLDLKKFELKHPNLLTNDELAEVLGITDTLKKWNETVKAHAIDLMLKGGTIEGFKLVEGRSTRSFSDSGQVLEKLERSSISETDYTEKKMKSLATLEKVLGKKVFTELLGEFVFKPKGSPTIADVQDKRPSYNSAENDFDEIDYSKES